MGRRPLGADAATAGVRRRSGHRASGRHPATRIRGDRRAGCRCTGTWTRRRARSGHRTPAPRRRSPGSASAGGAPAPGGDGDGWRSGRSRCRAPGSSGATTVSTPSDNSAVAVPSSSSPASTPLRPASQAVRMTSFGVRGQPGEVVHPDRAVGDAQRREQRVVAAERAVGGDVGDVGERPARRSTAAAVASAPSSLTALGSARRSRPARRRCRRGRGPRRAGRVVPDPDRRGAGRARRSTTLRWARPVTERRCSDGKRAPRDAVEPAGRHDDDRPGTQIERARQQVVDVGGRPVEQPGCCARRGRGGARAASTAGAARTGHGRGRRARARVGPERHQPRASAVTTTACSISSNSTNSTRVRPCNDLAQTGDVDSADGRTGHRQAEPGTRGDRTLGFGDAGRHRRIGRRVLPGAVSGGVQLAQRRQVGLGGHLRRRQGEGTGAPALRPRQDVGRIAVFERETQSEPAELHPVRRGMGAELDRARASPGAGRARAARRRSPGARRARRRLRAAAEPSRATPRRARAATPWLRRVGGERQLLASELGEAGDERGPAGVHPDLGRLEEPAVLGEVVGDRRDPPRRRSRASTAPAHARLRRPRLLDDVARPRAAHARRSGDDEHLAGDVRLVDARPNWRMTTASGRASAVPRRPAPCSPTARLRRPPGRRSRRPRGRASPAAAPRTGRCRAH